MPSSSPHPAPGSRPISPKFAFVLCLAAFALPLASAQTLARPGLVGNGINADPWWQHAVFYRTTASPDPEADFKAILARIDSIHSLGVDALLIPLPNLAPPSADSAPTPAFDAFDDLMRECSRRGIRTLLTVPASTTVVDLAGMARFWLTRGVAGFYVATTPGTSPQDAQTVLQALRKAAAATYGQRIVLSDLDPDAPAIPVAMPVPTYASRHSVARRAVPPSDPNLPQLQIDPRLGHLASLTAGNIRAALAQTLNHPGLALDIAPSTVSEESLNTFAALAQPLAAILLTTHPASVIEASAAPTLPVAAPEETAPAPTVPLPPPDPTRTFTIVTAKPPTPAKPLVPVQDPVTTWYQQLSQLHHDNAALRYGSLTLLDFDAQNALVWVAQPATNSPLSPPVVVLCNLASTPVHLDLGAAIKNLSLHGTYMRTLLRSDKSMGPQDLNGVILPPYGVYIGELHR